MILKDTILKEDTTVIIDTGCANLSSVRYAFERIGSNILVTDDITQIANASRVVLPGVGSAQAAMNSLKAKGLIDTIRALTQPVLGVCLGMQIMAHSSTESKINRCDCLGLIDTEIDELNSQGLPLPHMGWNQIRPNSHPLFAGVEAGSYLYFVHSYRAPLSQYTIAQSEYGEIFSAAIAKDNFMGVQFHPEKSATIGAKILKNFMAMTRESFPTANTKSSKTRKENQ